MKQEERKLLLKDLCARLPYGVICHYNCVIPCDRRVIEKVNARDVLKGIIPIPDGHIGFMVGIDKVDALEGDIKPYLRPMQSMTEEELNECVCQSGIKDIECPNWQDIPKEKQFESRLNHAIAVFLTDSNNVDWLNAHHFDYRGLIEMGLAFEAPEGMYETKTE